MEEKGKRCRVGWGGRLRERERKMQGEESNVFLFSLMLQVITF